MSIVTSPPVHRNSMNNPPNSNRRIVGGPLLHSGGWLDQGGSGHVLESTDTFHLSVSGNKHCTPSAKMRVNRTSMVTGSPSLTKRMVMVDVGTGEGVGVGVGVGLGVGVAVGVGDGVGVGVGVGVCAETAVKAASETAARTARTKALDARCMVFPPNRCSRDGATIIRLRGGLSSGRPALVRPGVAAPDPACGRGRPGHQEAAGKPGSKPLKAQVASPRSRP